MIIVKYTHWSSVFNSAGEDRGTLQRSAYTGEVTTKSSVMCEVQIWWHYGLVLSVAFFSSVFWGLDIVPADWTGAGSKSFLADGRKCVSFLVSDRNSLYNRGYKDKQSQDFEIYSEKTAGVEDRHAKNHDRRRR